MDTISEIIGKNLLDTFFQPVAELCDGNILGYEALSRGPENTKLYNPVNMISEAKCRNRMHELDSLFSSNALRNAASRGNSKLLFINIDPTAFMESDGEPLIHPEKYGVACESVVIEVSDATALCSLRGFQKNIAAYKEKGFKIAVDDLGSDFAQFGVLLGLYPDFGKIDRRYIQEIQNRPENRKMVSSLLTLASPAGTCLIAEGVENAEELDALMKIGMPAAQGNYLCRPGRRLGEIEADALAQIQSFQQKSIQERIISDDLL